MSKKLFQISIYVKGDFLDPAELSRMSGIDPDAAHVKGYTWLTSSGAVVKEATGLWCIKSWARLENEAELIYTFLRRAAPLAAVLRRVTGVESAYIDLFVAAEANGNSCDDVLIEFDVASLELISQLKLPLHITTSIVDE